MFPDSAEIVDGELSLGGTSARELADRFGTPLVVFCERTLRSRARAFRGTPGVGRVVYGTKAFPSVAVLRLLREEGIGADVASEGELAYAVAAGLTASELVVHGNNKDEPFLRAAGAIGATVVLDAPDEASLAAAAGVERALVRVTLGVDADTHEAIRTGHHGSKFGLPPDQARTLLAEALGHGIEVIGVHVHVGSQLADFDAQAETIVRLASFVAGCRDALGWVARVADLGGGFGIRHHPDERVPDAIALAESAAATAQTAFAEAGLPDARDLAGAGTIARRPGRCHALSRRSRQASGGAHLGGDRRRHVRQPEATALRRQVHRAERNPRGQSRRQRR